MQILTDILQTLGTPLDALADVTITGNDPILPSPFLIGESGAAAIAAIGYLSAKLYDLQHHQCQKITVSVHDAALAQCSHEYIKRLDGSNEPLWNPISGFYQTKDERFIQFHCNFPHHLEGVVKLLGCEADKDSVAKATKMWDAETLESELSALGMCAAMVRTPKEWAAHPQAKAVATLPLLEIIKIGDSSPESLPKGDRPLSGIRMLDLSRVLAGPVFGKSMAEHGAEVMLVSSPHLPSILPLVMDTGFGKLSTFLDLNISEDKDKLKQLIKQSDIFSDAYRPGGLAEKGFGPEALARLRPGIICVSFSAYSHLGPWANRHGYDSLVQSASGMVYEQSQGGSPRHLPSQSLDYITGFLAAAGAMEALRRRTLEGGSYLVRVSLAQTAHWFNALGRVKTDFSTCKRPTAEEIKPLLGHANTLFGELEYLLPVLNMSLTQPYFDKLTAPLGTHASVWI